ncbi:acetylpolyamine amidohydrolase [candidate division KSB1 bacterium]|nr:acetylpolyamine amidohydrolase [candidate division KSB1 bacterium]
MFRIRRIYDDVLPANRNALSQVQEILATQFRELEREKITKIPKLLRNPFEYHFRTIVYVAEDHKGRVVGCALLSHDPKLLFCYLDYLATSKSEMGGGIGGALYEQIREEAAFLRVKGLFYECLPDDPTSDLSPRILSANKRRLRFYEAYGARPIINTAYETPVTDRDRNPPYLVFDDLGNDTELAADYMKKVVTFVLKSKYGDICSADYIKKVAESYRDDPVQLRPPRYFKTGRQPSAVRSRRRSRQIALVVSKSHEIHHIRERGYVESPVRIRSILDSLSAVGYFARFEPRVFSEKYIRIVHDAAFIRYFKKACSRLQGNESVYPYVFPIRNHSRPPKELWVRAGYYCIDTFTPITANAFKAAKHAVDSALTAADKILEGYPAAYALVRPPGHHAERMAFGGFCYFNNAAIAAQYLSQYGRVAILDVDYHHGNGQQEIFYRRSDVLTISIHGRPNIAYPYFSGFVAEHGEEEGKGYNINYPLPLYVDGVRYLTVLQKALSQIRRFKPAYLIVCLGLDTARGDPTGSWSLVEKDFYEMGKRIASLHVPMLVVQEGGYNNRKIGANARSFFSGFAEVRFSPNHGRE